MTQDKGVVGVNRISTQTSLLPTTSERQNLMSDKDKKNDPPPNPATITVAGVVIKRDDSPRYQYQTQGQP